MICGEALEVCISSKPYVVVFMAAKWFLDRALASYQNVSVFIFEKKERDPYGSSLYTFKQVPRPRFFLSSFPT